jgi:hypothetical protein
MNGQEQWFRTVSCSAKGHPEICLRLAGEERLPLSLHVEAPLLDFFESSVAAGTRFLPGHTVDFAGSVLSIFPRPDGTLGVAEWSNSAWVDSVNEALNRAWLRNEVARSFALEAAFPSQRDKVLICNQIHNSQASLFLKRDKEEAEAGSSGWYVGCTDKSHDHDASENLDVIPITMITRDFPWLCQFFGLPYGTDLIVEMSSHVSVAVLWRGPDEASPAPGSYVAMLNERARAERS